MGRRSPDVKTALVAEVGSAKSTPAKRMPDYWNAFAETQPPGKMFFIAMLRQEDSVMHCDIAGFS